MTFRDLHYDDLPLVLPNAWDVPSALALLDAGFPAIGTTSFGVAASHGAPTAAARPGTRTCDWPGRLRPLDCHLSLDIEDGYAADPDVVADYVALLPVDGINIEDSTAETLVDPEVHAAKIRAIKARSPEIFVNARVDTYWLGPGRRRRRDRRPRHALRRRGRRRGVRPGVADPDVLRELARAIDRPLNVLAVPGMSPVDLAALGVRRVSTGSLPYRAALQAAVAVAAATRAGLMFPDAVSYAGMQER